MTIDDRAKALFLHNHPDADPALTELAWADTDPVLSLFGWCMTHGRPDQYHSLCRITYRSAVGVEHACSCSEHANDKPEESAD